MSRGRISSKKTKRKAKRAAVATSTPRSWELKTWPPEIWPHTEKRAQWIGRAYRTELLDARAMTRVGLKLVFIGSKYESWLERRARHVVEFQANNPAFGKHDETRAQ